jgi:signal transduction histidine kinase
MPDGASALVGWTAVAATLATDAVSLMPAVHFAYHAPGLHVALETTTSIAAALAAYLALGRFRRSRLLSDLLLSSALLVMALASVVAGLVPSSPESPTAVVCMWLAAGSSVAAAAVFAAAALVQTRAVRDVRRAERRAVLGVSVLIAGPAVALTGLAHLLPITVEPGVSPSSSESPQLVGHPVMLALQLVGLALFTIAAFGFTRRAGRTGDDFIRWLGVAAVLGAAAHANYMLYPSLYSDWVYTGDAFRLLFCVVILGAAAQQIRKEWESAAAAAVLDERRRLARDLHDGLAQELAHVLRCVRRLDEAEPLATRISSGIDRALDESRRAIAALTEPLDEPLEIALERTAYEAGRRAETRVRVEVSPGIEVTRAEREALVRIAAEAISNAGRHAGAAFVTLTCTNGDRVRLRVADAGAGFDPAGPAARASVHFGLVGMRERADEIGADFELHSAPGVGTTVEVTL